MGEPEFFLDKEDRFPKPILSEAEKDDITRKALNYEDTTPSYDPQNILDERYGGTSNYETGITVLGDELQAKLDRLKNDPEALTEDIEKIEQDLSSTIKFFPLSFNILFGKSFISKNSPFLITLFFNNWLHFF